MNDEIRVLDATGRTGQATALRPHQASVPIVPVGPESAEAVGGEFMVGQDVSPVKAGATRTLTNTAAWFGAKQTQLKVKPAPYTHPREDEIVVKNHAVAINPVDWLMPFIGKLIFPWIKYPFVLGEDLAGEVVEVGENVTRFKVRDRVLAHAAGTAKTRNSSAEGAFQTYTVVLAHMTASIPDTLPFENAAVLPLALSTAACGLFQKDQLALEYPSATPQATGKTLLVWGGSTSVGSNAIQLAVAAGYEVITTASPRNFEYVKKLGASQVFDYTSKTVVKDVIGAFKSKTSAGALAIGTGSAEACSDVVHACSGNKFVSTASTAVAFDKLSSSRGLNLQLPLLLLRMVSSTVTSQVTFRLRRIRTKFIFGSSLMDNEVGRMIFEDFLPRALEEGRYLAVPEPYIVGQGLESIQAGFDAQKQGVSARKVVVTL